MGCTIKSEGGEGWVCVCVGGCVCVGDKNVIDKLCRFNRGCVREKRSRERTRRENSRCSCTKIMDAGVEYDDEAIYI